MAFDTESRVVLDKINSWASANDMRLNPNKCKEMIREHSFFSWGGGGGGGGGGRGTDV
jgi:hypothetical protein